ncbi:MAG: methyltransferase domain-containing protein [Gammaproteobacteria bacterium]|nr:methyltransferase domain-containing protein [Gammaproteobacteria bacterium]
MGADKKWQEIAWGEHLHMGLYEGERDTRQQAMMRATARMAWELPIDAGSRVLEVACGAGQAARHLATQYGCCVHATNIDERQLELGRQLTEAAGLDHLVTFGWGDFHELDGEDDSLDLWWCQEALVHSPAKARVLGEAFRVLKPGGIAVLSDLVVTDDIEPDVRRRLYSRIPTEVVWTREQYAGAIPEAGFEVLRLDDWSDNVARSYDEAREILLARESELKEKVPGNVYDDTLELYDLWVDRARRGQIGWLHYRLRKRGA